MDLFIYERNGFRMKNLLKGDFEYIRTALRQSALVPVDDAYAHRIVSTWMSLFKSCKSLTLDSRIHPQMFLTNLGFKSVNGSSTVYSSNYVCGEKLFAFISYRGYDTYRQSVIVLKVQRKGSEGLCPLFKSRSERKHCEGTATSLVKLISKREYLDRMRSRFENLVNGSKLPFVVDTNRMDTTDFLSKFGYGYSGFIPDICVNADGEVRGTCWTNGEHIVYLLKVDFDENKVLFAYGTAVK